MSAIVVKSHSTDTSARAESAREITGFPVYGGVVLNYPVGGLNPYAALECARQGGRIVWMPTIGAAHFVQLSQHAPMLRSAIPPGVDGLRITDDSGRLLDAVLHILDVVAEHDLTLATGHVSPAESVALVETAFQRGVRRVIVTHPHVPFVAMNLEVASHLAALGAYIELTDHERIDTRVDVIRAVGVDRCFLSTDGGTVESPPPVERLAGFVAGLRSRGFGMREIRQMTVSTPRLLLQLPPLPQVAEVSSAPEPG